MSQYSQINLKRSREPQVVYGGLFESIFYETKPFLMLGIAAVASNNVYSNDNLTRASIGILFAAASYIIYRRLVHRGYLK